MVKKRVGGVEFSDLPCLASGKILKVTSNEMTDLRNQCIAVDDDNVPAPNNIPDEVTQLEDCYSWRQGGIILSR